MEPERKKKHRKGKRKVRSIDSNLEEKSKPEKPTKKKR